jgi:nucleoid DNA-binding protein
MLIVWRALVEYLNNNLRAGKSVNIKGFGSFTFDISTELPKIATKGFSPSHDLQD